MDVSLSIPAKMSDFLGPHHFQMSWAFLTFSYYVPETLCTFKNSTSVNIILVELSVCPSLKTACKDSAHLVRNIIHSFMQCFLFFVLLYAFCFLYGRWELYHEYRNNILHTDLFVENWLCYTHEKIEKVSASEFLEHRNLSTK